MIPVPATDEQALYWAERDDAQQRHVVIGGPQEAPDVIPCPALVAEPRAIGGPVVHVAMRLDEIEVAALAQGGTLWLTTWGGLPVHLVEVIGPGVSMTRNQGENR